MRTVFSALIIVLTFFFFLSLLPDQKNQASTRATNSARAPTVAGWSATIKNYADPSAELVVEKSLKFHACLAAIRGAASKTGALPINIVETDFLRIVRFNTTDGYILASCSARTNKLVMVKGS